MSNAFQKYPQFVKFFRERGISKFLTFFSWIFLKNALVKDLDQGSKSLLCPHPILPGLQQTLVFTGKGQGLGVNYETQQANRTTQELSKTILMTWLMSVFFAGISFSIGSLKLQKISLSHKNAHCVSPNSMFLVYIF